MLITQFTKICPSDSYDVSPFRVMVLDKGEIREFDSPNELLRNENGIFYGMSKDAGLV
jgi:hypothetical protein